MQQQRNKNVSVGIRLVILVFASIIVAQYYFSSQSQPKIELPATSASTISISPDSQTSQIVTSTVFTLSTEVTESPKIKREEEVTEKTRPQSSSKTKFQFPRYTLTQNETLLFPDLGSQLRSTSETVFRNHLQIPTTSSSALKTTPAIFETSYSKIDCGVVISNFCLQKNGQPRYFRPGQKFFSSTGSVRCCNEAETKFRFYSEMASPIPKDSPFPYPYYPNVILVAPMCWEQYGYHMFLCVLNTWSVMSQLVFPSTTTSVSNLKVQIGLIKSWSGHRIGSPNDWWNNNNDTSSGFKKSTFWAWWSVLTDHPSNVIDLESHPPMCVPFGVVAGKMDKFGIITPGMQQKFRRAMLDRLEIPTLTYPRTFLRVTIVNRAKSFKLLNAAELATQFKNARGSETTITIETQIVVFEELSLKEQMTIAANTDIMIGMHGNGLTWSAFMEPGSALLEMWPAYVYNGNYAHFAGRGNIKHWNLIGRKNTVGGGGGGNPNSNDSCVKRCDAAIPIPETIMNEVIQFVIGTKIKKTITYTGENDYLASQAEYAKEKKNKKKNKK